MKRECRELELVSLPQFLENSRTDHRKQGKLIKNHHTKFYQGKALADWPYLTGRGNTVYIP